MKMVFGLLAILLSTVSMPDAYAGECQKCHASFGSSYMQPKVPAVRVQAAGRTDVITLADLYAEHGHPCVGTGIAFRAVQIGMHKLYGDTVPQRDDLLIFSQMPGPGVLDAVDRIIQGPESTAKTVAPAGMQLARDNFVFTLMRQSTGQMVTVRLKPEVLAKDFFPLKARMKKQQLSPEQWQVLHAYIRQAVGVVIRDSDEQLFDVTTVAPQVMWRGASAQAGGAAGHP